MAIGTVKFFKREKGWGAIASEELPAGVDAFAHFSVIEGEGFRELTAGKSVEFDYEAAHQDSFEFRATRVRRLWRPPGAETYPDSSLILATSASGVVGE